jgi:hypothetical protein
MRQDKRNLFIAADYVNGNSSGHLNTSNLLQRTFWPVILSKLNILFLAVSDHFPVTLWCDTFLFFEATNEIARFRKTAVLRNIRNGNTFPGQ